MLLVVIILMNALMRSHSNNILRMHQNKDTEHTGSHLSQSNTMKTWSNLSMEVWQIRLWFGYKFTFTLNEKASSHPIICNWYGFG